MDIIKSSLEMLYKRTFIIIAFLLIGCFVLYQSYRAWYIHTQKTVLEQFKKQREETIYNFFDSLAQSVESIAADKQIQECLQEALQFASSSSAPDMKLFRSSSYMELYKKCKDIVRHKHTPFVRAIMFVSPKGQLIFSEDIREDLGLVIPNSIYQHTQLASVIKKVQETQKTTISDFSHYPAMSVPTSFIAVPVLQNNTMIGIIVAEMNQKKFYDLTHDTQVLGKTGEVVLGKKEGDKVVLVTPSVEDPTVTLMRKVPIGDRDYAYTLQSAARNESLTQKSIDYSGKSVLASWKPLKLFSWILVVKKDMAEIDDALQPIKRLAIIMSIILLGLLLLIILYVIGALWWHGYLSIMYRKLFFMMRGIIMILSVTITLIFLWLIHRTVQTQLYIISQVKVNAKIRGQYAIQLMTHYFLALQEKMNVLAKDIAQQKYDTNAIKTSFNTALESNKDLKGLMYLDDVQNAKPSGLYEYRDRDEKIHTDESFKEKYVLTKELRDLYQSKTARWTEPFFDPTTHALVLAYGLPLQNNQESPRMIIFIYSLNALKELMLLLGTSGTGYSFIVTQNGRLLTHPNQIFIQEENTIFDIAKIKKLPALAHVGDEIKKGNRGVMLIEKSLFSGASWDSGFIWAYYQKIPIADWSLVNVFLNEGVSKSVLRFKKYIILDIVFLVLMVLMGVLLCATIWSYRWRKDIWVYGILYSCMAFFGTVSILFVHRKSPALAYEDIIFDNVVLQRFLERIEETDEKRYRDPFIPVKTGILINTIDFDAYGTISFTGYVWQHITKEFENVITKGIHFPQAQKIEINQAYEIKKPTETTIGWQVEAALAQDSSYKQYPFDVKHVKIIMGTNDKGKHVILVPDLAAYSFVNPSGLAGINKGFLPEGFLLKKSFFSFNTFISDTSLGITDEVKNYEKVLLIYNILLHRGLLHVFFVFFFPLLVILFWLFALLLGIERIRKPDYGIINAYTALFFSALIGQQLFRSQFKISVLTYMEYLYLFVYAVIFILIIDSVLLVVSNKFHKNIYLSHWYWPLISSFWFLVTFIKFY